MFFARTQCRVWANQKPPLADEDAALIRECARIGEEAAADALFERYQGDDPETGLDLGIALIFRQALAENGKAADALRRKAASLYGEAALEEKALAFFGRESDLAQEEDRRAGTPHKSLIPVWSAARSLSSGHELRLRLAMAGLGFFQEKPVRLGSRQAERVYRDTQTLGGEEDILALRAETAKEAAVYFRSRLLPARLSEIHQDMIALGTEEAVLRQRAEVARMLLSRLVKDGAWSRAKALFNEWPTPFGQDFAAEAKAELGGEILIALAKRRDLPSLRLFIEEDLRQLGDDGSAPDVRAMALYRLLDHYAALEQWEAAQEIYVRILALPRKGGVARIIEVAKQRLAPYEKAAPR